MRFAVGRMLALGASGAVAIVGFVGLLGAPGGATTVNDETTFRNAWTLNALETQIDLAANITLTCAAGGVAIRNSTIPLTLDGHGFTITQTCANNGVLEQDGTGDITIKNVTITGGHALNGGGGFEGGSTITFDHATVTGNSAGQGGGGIQNGNGSAHVNIIDSTISNNSSATEGGGGLSAGGGTSVITVTRSTFSGNTAGAEEGGAIDVGGGGSTLTITNSTITGNSAPDGGGVSGGGGNGTLALVYSTIAGNTAPVGANVSIGGPGTHTSFATVIAYPQGGGANCSLGSFPLTSSGYSYEQGANTCGFGAGPGDVVNGPDPLLGALAANGGPTATRLPQTGSLLIDAIPASACQADGASGITTDQRGVSRPQQSGCDIGAVEVAAPPPVTATPRFTG